MARAAMGSNLINWRFSASCLFLWLSTRVKEDLLPSALALLLALSPSSFFIGQV
jgi:hypothetical protein